jgi:uncharacterized protein (TIGR01777 family)
MRKVLISGGTGLVGSRLKRILKEKGYEVFLLSRKESDSSKGIIHWNPEKGILNPEEIDGMTHIINLAGAGIADKKWTKERKELIKTSRTNSIALLAKCIDLIDNKPISFVTASAVGYYGLNTQEKAYKESDVAGIDFLAETCIAWEKEADKVSKLHISTSKIRIGIVLDKNGGALKEMAKPVKLGFGSALGSGKLYIPWIHIDDLCALFIFAMENKKNEVYNAASPYQLNNLEFTKILAKVLKKPMWLPAVPGALIKLIMGDRAQLVLEGSKVDVSKVIEDGFVFKYPSLENALSQIYGN